MSPVPPEDRASGEETSSLPPSRLKPGDVLAGRFTIVRFIARGGMGEVYEARDQHLQDKHHALKTLRADLARNESLRSRFEREVLLAREVHHPHVCPTYDLFHVTDATGPISFLTMKLLHGESLHTRIRREGRLASDVVKVIAHQLASALDAAHASGVVHRDLKPGNIVLEEDSRGPHVSVTDFGLSRIHDAEETIGGPGQLLGTPGYMAPEVLRGQTAGFGVDIYAFGVVVYEMLTGRRPDDPLFPTLPSSLVPDLDPYWDRVIEGCLTPQPQYRFKTAADALALAPREKPTGPLPTPPPPRRTIFKGVATAITVAVVVAAGGFAAWNWDALVHPLPDKRYVALMAWPLDGDAAHRPLLRTVLDTVGSRLARAESSTGGFMVIAAGDVGGQAAMKLPQDAATTLGANLVLTTAIENTADGVRLRMAVIESESGRTVRERSQEIATTRLPRLSESAAAMAAGLLDVRVSGGSRTDQEEIAALPPAAFQLLATADELAARPNDAGLNEAIATYQRLLEAQPRFAVGHAKLSAAYVVKHRRAADRATVSLAERNADLALRLNPDSVSAILSDAEVDLHLGRVADALAGLQRALDLDPGNPQILVVKARAFRTLDRLKDEEAVHRELIRNRPNYWPAYDQLGLSLYRQARYEEAAAAFTEGTVVAPQVVRLLNNLGAMQMLLQRRDDAMATFRRSVAASPTTTAYQNLGTLAFGKNDYAAALDYYQQAHALNPRDELSARNIGDVYAVLRDRTRSIEHYAKGEALVAQSLKINPKRGETWMISAYYHAKLGNRAAAESSLEKAETLGASGIPSQLKKVQTLVLLGRQEQALSLLIELRQKGLSHQDVELAIDLRELRQNPRYLATLKTNPS